MTQFELFSPPPVQAGAPAGPVMVPLEALRRHLQEKLGLWVDEFTAQYIARSLGRGAEEIEFIAADARTGRSAFHTSEAAALRPD